MGICAVPGWHKMSHPQCQDPRGDSGRDSWCQHEVSAAQVVVLMDLAPFEHPLKPGMIQGLRLQLRKAEGGGAEWDCHCVVVSHLSLE